MLLKIRTAAPEGTRVPPQEQRERLFCEYPALWKDAVLRCNPTIYRTLWDERNGPQTWAWVSHSQLFTSRADRIQQHIHCVFFSRFSRKPEKWLELQHLANKSTPFLLLLWATEGEHRVMKNNNNINVTCIRPQFFWHQWNAFKHAIILILWLLLLLQRQHGCVPDIPRGARSRQTHTQLILVSLSFSFSLSYQYGWL